jgi:hypothetical protein
MGERLKGVLPRHAVIADVETDHIHAGVPIPLQLRQEVLNVRPQRHASMVIPDQILVKRLETRIQAASGVTKLPHFMNAYGVLASES